MCEGQQLKFRCRCVQYDASVKWFIFQYISHIKSLKSSERLSINLERN